MGTGSGKWFWAARAQGAKTCLPAQDLVPPTGARGPSQPGSHQAPEDAPPLTVVTGPGKREAATFGGKASGDPPNEGQTLRSESSTKGLQGCFKPRENKPLEKKNKKGSQNETERDGTLWRRAVGGGGAESEKETKMAEPGDAARLRPPPSPLNRVFSPFPFMPAPRFSQFDGFLFKRRTHSQKASPLLARGPRAVIYGF